MRRVGCEACDRGYDLAERSEVDCAEPRLPVMRMFMDVEDRITRVQRTLTNSPDRGPREGRSGKAVVEILVVLKRHVVVTYNESVAGRPAADESDPLACELVFPMKVACDALEQVAPEAQVRRHSKGLACASTICMRRSEAATPCHE